MKNFKSFNLVMKKINPVFLFSCACLLFLTSFAASSVKAQPGATFERMWVDYGVKEANQTGMRIHAKFTVNNLKSADCQLRIKFFYSDEKPLRDDNKRFYTTDGNVAAFGDIKPGYNPAVYEDFTIFMPYDEFDLTDGEYNLKMDADLIYKDGELIQHLTWYDFTYSKKPPATNLKATVTFDKMWVQYDVTESGQFGMRIHAKFSVSNMKDKTGYLALFFDRGATDTRLKSYDNKYQSLSKEVVAMRSITPGYEVSVYQDYDVFIPYAELHLTKGEHNLRIDADLLAADQSMIQHLGFENFKYWKQ